LLILDPAWVAAIAAVLYAGFTLWLILEMRADRKLLYEPIVTAEYKNTTFPSSFLFGLKNAGRGPAKIVRLRCFADTGVEWKLDNPILPISLGSNESIELHFGWVPFISENYKGFKEVTVTAEYNDILGKVYKEQILNFKMN